MAKEEWGTKRMCPETGKRFYDLNKNPVISPYTGKEIISDKSSSEVVKSSSNDNTKFKEQKFDSTEELIDIEDDLILEGDDDSTELDSELLEEDTQDTVPLEEITDVPSSESEEN